MYCILADIDFGAMNEVYIRYFNISSNELDSYPARAALPLETCHLEHKLN